MNDIIKDIQGSTFSVKTPSGGYKTFTVEDIFSVDETDLTAEYIKQPALYGFFATAAAMAEDYMNRADFSCEQEYAAADASSRREMELNGQKYTEPLIKGMVLRDEQYSDAMERALKVKYDYKLLKAIVSSLEQRANMLISLGSHLRHEETMTGMSIKERVESDSIKNVRDAIQARRSAK